MRYFESHCHCIESREGGKHTYTFFGPCYHTGKTYQVTVPAEGLYKYRQGALIQNAFPDLSVEDREFLLTGYSPEGWKLAFPTPDDDEDDDGDFF